MKKLTLILLINISQRLFTLTVAIWLHYLRVGADIDPTDISSALEFLWHKGPDFQKGGTPVPVIFRIATVEDKKRMTAAHTTRRLWLAADHANGSGGGGKGRRRERGDNGRSQEGGKERRRRLREEYDPEDDAEMMDTGVRICLPGILDPGPIIHSF